MYTKTVQIWGNEDKILSGAITLTTGQWVQCGDGIKSRYVGLNGHNIIIAHGGNYKQVNAKFTSLVESKRLNS